MAVISFIAFAIGLISYVCALLFLGTRNAEIASDLGNGAMLVSIAVMLFRINRRMTQDGRAAESAPTRREP